MQVKVCGITNIADALMVADLGVNYLGYIVNHTASPRYITPTAAAHIIRKVRKVHPQIRHVGVVVDANKMDCQNIIDELDADIIQFHGSESPEYIQNIKYIQKWKAIELETADAIQLIPQFETVVEGILLDSGKGSGQLIPAELLSSVKIQPTFILAGGITPENILERLQLCTPDIIDINSGVEIEPGKKPIRKDREKIIACLNLIKDI